MVVQLFILFSNFISMASLVNALTSPVISVQSLKIPLSIQMHEGQPAEGAQKPNRWCGYVPKTGILPKCVSVCVCVQRVEEKQSVSYSLIYFY